ncbi:hypothetical protein Poli38472_008337 [Pythium oligandrum]|uniref:Uncharacterized protein n=1 Tax=Pythium oligandrum TaxID=41045 RepID=A0A8K1CLX6_PYTOL|nr:hypothetical protein Poli38472_008337 [Pythium oligandrum]|eukprot:TMW65695.1 hypothetical protein Poli38472_008337 [Pythium oligandrum]
MLSPRRAGPKTKVTAPSVQPFLSSMGILVGEETHIVDKEVNEVSTLRREYDTVKNTNVKKENEIRKLEEEIETMTTTLHSRMGDTAQLKAQANGIENKSALYQSKLDEELADQGVYTHMIQRLTSEALTAKKATNEKEKQLAALMNELTSSTSALLAARQEKTTSEQTYKKLYEDWWEKKQESIRALDDMQQAVEQTRLKYEILEQREVSRKKHVQEAIGEMKMKESRRLRHESYAQMTHFSEIQEELSDTDIRLLAVEAEFKKIIEAAGTNDVDKIISKFVNRDETLRALKEEHAVADARMRKLREKHKQLNETLGSLRSSAINTRTIYQEMDQTSERLKDIEKDAAALSEKFNRTNVMMDAFRACMLKCLTKLSTVRGSLDYDDHHELSRVMETPTSDLLHMVEQKLNRVLDVINREKAERELHRSEASGGAGSESAHDKHSFVRAPAPSESEQHFILRMSSPNTSSTNVRVRPTSRINAGRAPAMSVALAESVKQSVVRRPHATTHHHHHASNAKEEDGDEEYAHAVEMLTDDDVVIDRAMRKKLVGLVVNRGKRGKKPTMPSQAY